MITQRVSRKDLRAIKVGQVGVFTLPTYRAVESARVQVSALRRREGLGFERLFSEDELTLIYKRTK